MNHVDLLLQQGVCGQDAKPLTTPTPPTGSAGSCARPGSCTGTYTYTYTDTDTDTCTRTCTRTCTGTIAALIAIRSLGERQALGLLDSQIGPLDPQALALGLGWSVGESAATLQRLVAAGLVVLPVGARSSPAVVRHCGVCCSAAAGRVLTWLSGAGAGTVPSSAS